MMKVAMDEIIALYMKDVDWTLLRESEAHADPTLREADGNATVRRGVAASWP
jgi:hypothetical protein